MGADVVRWGRRLLLLVLTGYLAVWVWEGLFRVDRTGSLLPFRVPGDTTGIGPIFLGSAWGILITTGIFDSGGPRKVSGRRLRGTAIATVRELRRTGTTINDVPQYDVFLDVTPPSGGFFIAQLRTLLEAAEAAELSPGSMIAVHYDPDDPDAVEMADLDDPGVQQAVLQWRITKGLLPPEQVGARLRGTTSPASVVSLRPTGGRLEGHVEVALRLLVTPSDGGAPWEVDTTTFLHPDALGRVQVASPVYAMYEPHDPMTVAMTIEDWSGTGATG